MVMLKRMALALVAAAALGCGAEQPGATTSANADANLVTGSFDRFIQDRSEDTWRNLQAVAGAHPHVPESQSVRRFRVCQEAMLHRDLPNTMAWDSPEEAAKHVEDNIRILEREINSLKPSVPRRFLELLDAMVWQTFDDQFTYAAAEIIYRLSPARFEKLAREADRKAHSRPGVRRIVKFTREVEGRAYLGKSPG